MPNIREMEYLLCAVICYSYTSVSNDETRRVWLTLREATALRVASTQYRPYGGLPIFVPDCTYEY